MLDDVFHESHTISYISWRSTINSNKCDQSERNHDFVLFDSRKVESNRSVVTDINRCSYHVNCHFKYNHADKRLLNWVRYINANEVIHTVRSHETDSSHFLVVEEHSNECHTTNVQRQSTSTITEDTQN